jgi:DNA invertase Pin-like site-specific DNA recombinase
MAWKQGLLARSLPDLILPEGRVVLTGEGAAVDTPHAQGRMIFGILAGMTEFERDAISERTGRA